MKIFFDTNILLDITLKREPFYSTSEHLILECIKVKHTKILSSLSVANIHYSVKKALTLSLANVGIKQILEHFEVSSVNANTVKNAHLANWKDFEDAIQYYSAIEAGANLIVTRDVKGYEEKQIKVVTPENAFLLITQS